jgi:hypothetical protein
MQEQARQAVTGRNAKSKRNMQYKDGKWEWEKYGKWRTEWYKNKKENGKMGTHEEKNEIPIRTYSKDGAVNTGYLRY